MTNGAKAAETHRTKKGYGAALGFEIYFSGGPQEALWGSEDAPSGDGVLRAGRILLWGDHLLLRRFHCLRRFHRVCRLLWDHRPREAVRQPQKEAGEEAHQNKASEEEYYQAFR